MRLLPGEYVVQVSADGYVTREAAVAHGATPTDHLVTLIPPQPFSVTTTPASASVQLVGGTESYRLGMRLAPGDYVVRVSADEYLTYEGTVAHGASPTDHRVTLARRPQPFTVTATPASAMVQLVGFSGTYRAGMRLAPGEYTVRVSANEYETHEATVAHGGSPTNHLVTLVRRPQPFTVAVRPSGASVALTGPPRTYRTGMRLPPGTIPRARKRTGLRH